MDLLHDEGEAFGSKMDEAAAEVTVTRYNGLVYDGGLMDPVKNVPAVKTALRGAAEELKIHLK